MFNDQRREFRPAVARRTVNDAVRPAVPVRGGVSGNDALDDLIRALRDERGLASATGSRPTAFADAIPRVDRRAWTGRCAVRSSRVASGPPVSNSISNCQPRAGWSERRTARLISFRRPLLL